MRSGEREVDPVPETRPPSAAPGPCGGVRRTDEEERLQAAIAMTQLLTGDRGKAQGQWRHLEVGATLLRDDEVRGRLKFRSPRNGTVMEENSEGAAEPGTGEERSAPEEVDPMPAYRDIQSTVKVEIAGSFNCCTVETERETAAGQSLGGNYCDAVKSERETEGGESVRSDYCGTDETERAVGESSLKYCYRGAETNSELVDVLLPGKDSSHECGIEREEKPMVFPTVVPSLDQTSFSSGGYLKGKFVRTAQPSDPGRVSWTRKQTVASGDVTDQSLSVNCEVTPSIVVKRKTAGSSADNARPLKMPRQRKSSKNAPATKTKESSSDEVRHESTGPGSTSAVTTESTQNLGKDDTLPGQALRGMVFAFNPNGGVFIPLGPLAPIFPTTILEAERQFYAWLPSSAGSTPHRLTPTSESVDSASLPPCASPRRDDLKPSVTYASTGNIPASVTSLSFNLSEDVDTMLSSDAVSVPPWKQRPNRRKKSLRTAGGKSNGRDGKTEGTAGKSAGTDGKSEFPAGKSKGPDGKSEGTGGKSECADSRTLCTFETPHNRAFKVEENVEARSVEVYDGESDFTGIPINECYLSNRLTQRLDFETDHCVDLCAKNSDSYKIGETPAIVIKPETKSLNEPPNFGSCSSPLDLTTNCVSYGSLGTLTNFYALSGSTVKSEKYDTDLGNFKNDVINGIRNSEPMNFAPNPIKCDPTPMDGVPNPMNCDPNPMDCDPNQMRHAVPRTEGLAVSLGHGSVMNELEGSCHRPVVSLTSSILYEQKSPSADSTVDYCDFNQIIRGSFKDAVWQLQNRASMNPRDPEFQFFRPGRTDPLLPRSVLDLSSSEAEDAFLPSDNPLIWDHSRGALTQENAGPSLPGSQCRNDLTFETSRHQENCRLPPKKRKRIFDPEVQPGPRDLDSPNGLDLSKSSIKEESSGMVSHPELTTSNGHNHQHHPFDVRPLHADGCSRDGVETLKRPKEPISGLDIVVKLEFRETEDTNGETIQRTGKGREEFGQGGRNVVPVPSSYSSPSSSPLMSTTSTNVYSMHSAIRPDEDGDLPLHVAVAQGLELVVDSLVSVMSQLDAHIDAFNKNRQTPLHVAVITNQREIVRRLLHAGACPNLSDRKGHNSVHLAVNNRCNECLRILLSDSKYPVDVDAMNYEGLMPLHLAVQLGDIHSVEALLSLGAQVNGVDGKNGRTALYYAAEKSDLATADLLLQTGANPSIASYSGCLPVNAARANAAMVKLLERYSAGGDAGMGSGTAAAGVAMATAKAGSRETKRRDGKQVKSKE